MKFFIAVLIIAFLCQFPVMAQSTDSRCDKPPFGAPEADYLAYTNNFERLLPAGQIMPTVCAAKFNGGDTAVLHAAGLSDAQIRSENVAQLTIGIATALWHEFHPGEHLSSDPPSSEDNRPRIYGLFNCESYSNTCTIVHNGPLQGGLFRSEEECEKTRALFKYPPGGKIWFECRSKAVDDWQK